MCSSLILDAFRSLLPEVRDIRSRIRLLMALSAWIVLLPTCLALFQLRAIDPAAPAGFMAAIWVSDTRHTLPDVLSENVSSRQNQPGQDLGRRCGSVGCGRHLCAEMELVRKNGFMPGGCCRCYGARDTGNCWGIYSSL